MSDFAAPVFDSAPPPAPPSGGLAALKIAGGLLFSGCTCCGIFSAGYQGAAVAGILGLLTGAGVASIVSGVVNLAGKRTGFGVPVALAVLVLLGAVFGGPPAARWIRVESQKNEAESLSKDRNAVALRNLLAELRKEKAELGLDHDEAIRIATEGLAASYKDALDKVSARPAAEGADQDLRNAFQALLEDLAQAETSDIHLAFTNRTVLDAPEESQLFLMVRYNELSEEDRTKHPDMAKTVIAEGEAFSPAHDEKRRKTFESAFGEAMGQVFTSELLKLAPLGQGEVREGKLVLEVASTIRRGSGFYNYTSEDAFAGFLFEIVVEWGFQLYDRKGNLLYETKTESTPATEIQIRSKPTDPVWAPYSVMMDSAYYNYSREIITKFGLTPPAEKTVFPYE